LEYLQPRLLEPLDIQGATSESCHRGIHIGGWGMKIKTDDIAKFGQLYLQKGQWDGNQLIPEIWVEEATTKQISNDSSTKNDWAQGYGYQFWRCRHGAYRGDRAFGQFCIVLPEQDAVIAITSGVNDTSMLAHLASRCLSPTFLSKMPEPAYRIGLHTPRTAKIQQPSRMRKLTLVWNSMEIVDTNSLGSLARISEKVSITQNEEYTASAFAYIEQGSIDVWLIFYNGTMETIVVPTSVFITN
jgi:CubicO group peptidase (beta-lactamase class C family)